MFAGSKELVVVEYVWTAVENYSQGENYTRAFSAVVPF